MLIKYFRVALLIIVGGLHLPAKTVAKEQPLYPVTICVHDPTDAPVPDAEVRVIPAPEPIPQKMQTDSRGELSVRLKAGGHAVFVSGQGLVSDVLHIEVNPSPQPQRFYSILRVGTFGGPVLVEDGSAPPDVILDAAPYRKPWTLTAADLAAMPRTNVVVQDPSKQRAETYSGVRMHDLLVLAGAPLGKEFYGVALLTSVKATGYARGMKQSTEVVYALAEFDASNKRGDFLLADTVNGHAIEPDEGPFVLISTADSTHRRWVPGLKSLVFRPGLAMR